jgi:4a-hydroxytetrahydrobiopterin dehydratase
LDPSAILPIETVQERLEKMPMWQLVTSDGKCPFLQRSFVAKSFQAALDAVNAMGAIAEQENHHPDFHLTDYRNVAVDVYTHKVQGITENDLTLAQLLDDNVPVTYSPKWLRENPTIAAAVTDKN